MPFHSRKFNKVFESFSLTETESVNMWYAYKRETNTKDSNYSEYRTRFAADNEWFSSQMKQRLDRLESHEDIDLSNIQDLFIRMSMRHSEDIPQRYLRDFMMMSFLKIYTNYKTRVLLDIHQHVSRIKIGRISTTFEFYEIMLDNKSIVIGDIEEWKLLKSIIMINYKKNPNSSVVVMDGSLAQLFSDFSYEMLGR